MLARRGAQRAQPVDLAARLGRDLLGECGLLDATQQLDRFPFAQVRLAELGLDRLQLLTQEELAMVPVDSPFGLLAHLLVHPRLRGLALPTLGQELEPSDHVDPLHHFVLLGRTQRAARGGEVGEARRP